ncbi:hypothetical protein ACVWYG_003805 [Pedobacter sp. UYEF25]
MKFLSIKDWYAPNGNSSNFLFLNQFTSLSNSYLLI